MTINSIGQGNPLDLEKSRIRSGIVKLKSFPMTVTHDLEMKYLLPVTVSFGSQRFELTCRTLNLVKTDSIP